MSKAKAAEVKPSKKEKAVHRVTMSKADKCQLAMSKAYGFHRPSKANILDSEQEYTSWRKDGFKGAWWQHYFSRNEKD
jgi:hypothetical protein